MYRCASAHSRPRQPRAPPATDKLTFGLPADGAKSALNYKTQIAQIGLHDHGPTCLVPSGVASRRPSTSTLVPAGVSAFSPPTSSPTSLGTITWGARKRDSRQGQVSVQGDGLHAGMHCRRVGARGSGMAVLAKLTTNPDGQSVRQRIDVGCSALAENIPGCSRRKSHR